MGDLLTALPEVAAKGVEAAAPAAADAAGAIGGAPLNILSDAAAFAPSAVGDIVGATGASAANLAASGGDLASGLGSSGFGIADAAGAGAGGATTAFTDTGLGAGAFDTGTGASTAGTTAATPTGATPGAGSPSFADLTAQPTAAPGVASPASGIPGSGAAAAPAAGIGAGNVAPVSGAATGAADATSSWGDLLKKGLTSNPLGAGLAAAGLGYNIYNGQKQTANQAGLTQAAQQAAGNNTKLTDAGIAQIGNNTATANKLTDIGTGQTQQNIANNNALNDKGAALQSYLSTGTLPPEYMSQVDTAISDAKTTAISNAAKNGQPTDPTRNTSLAQQLAQIDQQKPGMVSKLAETLFQSGTSLEQIGTGANTSAAGSLLGSGVNTNNASASSLLSGGQNAAGLSGQLYSTLTNLDTQQSKQTADAIAALAKAFNGGQPNTTQKSP